MAFWLNEVASGASDGVNDLFKVTVAYRPGTTSVRVNGLQLTPAEWTELGGKTIRILEPPDPLHRVTVRFRTVT